MKKKILFICKKECLNKYNSSLHFDWVNDCSADYDIDFWGRGFGSYKISNLRKKIDAFKPDYLYLTMRKHYEDWLPDLTNIKVNKIFVENDNWEYSARDSWYRQFDQLYSRQSIWGKKSRKYNKELCSESKFKKRISYLKTWESFPMFNWSVSESSLTGGKSTRNGVFCIGWRQSPMYENRRHMKGELSRYIRFLPKGSAQRLSQKEYWKVLYSASALVCPTDSSYGDFIPAKMFEYAASGAAVLTNCDLIRYADMPDLDSVVIKYKNLQDLIDLIKNTDFKKHYNVARDVIRNYTHRIRYREIFLK